MDFNLLCSTSLPVFNQAIKTCDTKAEDTDSSFYFEESDGSLYITSHNAISEQRILLPTAKLESDAKESFFVSGHAIVEFFRQFPEEEALCTYKDSLLTVKGTLRDINFEFPTSLPNDYAPINCVKQSSPIDCDAQSLALALKMTTFSASSDKDDGALTAVCVAIEQFKLVAQSADNQRISKFEIAIDDTEDAGNTSFLLPKATSDVLSNLLDDISTVQITKCKNHAKFEWEDTVFITRLISDIDNSFAELTDIMSGAIISTVEISKAEVLKSLKLVGLLAKDSYVTLVSNDQGLTVSTDRKDKGSGTIPIIAQSVSGEAETSLPYKNLLKGIEVTSSPWITLEFRDMSFVPVAGINIVDKDFQHFIFPVMPNSDD